MAGRYIVDISRDFLDSSGVGQRTEVFVASPSEEDNYFRKS